MIAHFLASDERETSLLVKTGSQQEAMNLQKYISDQLYLQEGSLKQFKEALISYWTIGKFYTICFDDDLEALEAAEQCIRDYVNRVNTTSESKDEVLKEEKETDTEENLEKLRKAKKILKNEGYVLERADVGPLMGSMDDFKVYLHDQGGFDWDEVYCLVDNNIELIQQKLDLGMSYEHICDYLDDSCLKKI